MKNAYSIFLTIELARTLGIIPKDLEYDLTWEKGEELHAEFEGSDFNDSHDSEYDCIEKFLKDYRRKHALEIIPLATNEKATVYSVENHWPIQVSANAHTLLIEDEYIHFDGRNWVYFDSDAAYISDFARQHE